jgi:geranylgeranyl pyrophosphate synthase
MMDWKKKVAALEAFYQKSFEQPRWIAEVSTSGSYAKKVRALARLGRRTPEEVEVLCQQVEHLRRAFKIMDDLIDEDVIRDGKPAFWVLHGEADTIEQAAWHLWEARELARQLGCELLFEQRLREVIEGARLEVELEAGWEPPDLAVAWHRVVQKESSFRLYLAEALFCPPEVCEAARQDGVAAQILDDGLSALYGKDGRPPENSSDERLGRLTYMRAFGVTPQEAVSRGPELKKKIAPILGRKGGGNEL